MKGCKLFKHEMRQPTLLNWFRRKNEPRKVLFSLSEQYQKLQQVGINLESNFILEQITDEFDDKEYEEKPFILLLISMGSEIEIDGASTYPSNDIWYFDRECIEDTGDYVEVIKRIAQLIKGELVISNIHDRINIENNEASISFNINEEYQSFDLNVDNDWIDIGIFKIFSDLLKQQGSELRFYYSDLGQGFLVGAFRDEQGAELNKVLNIFLPFA